jgi:hypothetical protein
MLPNAHEWFSHVQDTIRHHASQDEYGVNGKLYHRGQFEPFYIPREIMPQVDESAFDELFAFLSEHGITVSRTMAELDTIRPHQKVDHKRIHGLLSRSPLMAKPILVSSDGFIIDGHHRFEAHRQNGDSSLPVIRLSATFKDALPILFAFPKTWTVGEDNRIHD